ncbi:carbon-nitrogen hydrolase family protein [Arthrobacter sp. SDTb3-6]|nr:carbon-nitrogen hydrolase family protein [Arthrobacter sp. SDTb3-6]NVM98133.1 carbon-nitrogen hydrolase family protein [Arthrobacter sp. SDTb3-6]
MPRTLPIAAVQAQPRLIGEPLSAFAEELAEITFENPEVRLVMYPELHLFGDQEPAARRNQTLLEAAQPINGDLVKDLGAMAGDLKIWLVPGSICELSKDGDLFNTALAFSPEGKLVASYRKIFPWRPSEPYVPGNQFVVFDLDGVGRAGLSICYDAWFPEHSRQLAWLGADVILNVVKTTTPDRQQELILARANAIVNQTFMVSVNCAGPVGMGKSLVVDPEGLVRTEAFSENPMVLLDTLDLGHVDRVRRFGTAGLNRMWSQYRSSDRTVELPMYAGRIDPANWQPSTWDSKTLEP